MVHAREQGGLSSAVRTDFPNSSWPGLTRPPNATASAVAKDSFSRADARLLGGRLKGGHDEFFEVELL
jgi:hypothetical protein